MALNVQLISQPGAGVKEILLGRIAPTARKATGMVDFNAAGLIQGRLIDMIYAADVAEKAAAVQVFDLKGLCPQHLTMIGIFGDIAAVKSALAAVEEDDRTK